MIIVVEGIDASGKATQVKKLSEAIQANVFDYPRYDTPTGQLIKKVLKAKDSDLFTQFEWALLLQSLMTTNRQESQKVLRPYSDLINNHVIVDRYYASGLVYGEADGLPRNLLVDIHSGLLPADIWFLVDISVEESFRRRPVRRDNYESRADLLQKARDGYLSLFRDSNNPFPGKWFVINGNQPDDMVHADICKILKNYIIWPA